MSCCPKEIKMHDVYNNMGEDDLEYTLASCEQSCDKYYGCDTASEIMDKLKELKGE